MDHDREKQLLEALGNRLRQQGLDPALAEPTLDMTRSIPKSLRQTLSALLAHVAGQARPRSVGTGK